MTALQKPKPAAQVLDREPANEAAFHQRGHSTFLNAEDLASLTGIRGGAKGLTRAQRQIKALKTMKVPHFVNAAGLPVVARAVIEGARAAAEPTTGTWQPALGH